MLGDPDFEAERGEAVRRQLDGFREYLKTDEGKKAMERETKRATTFRDMREAWKVRDKLLEEGAKLERALRFYVKVVAMFCGLAYVFSGPSMVTTGRLATSIGIHVTFWALGYSLIGLWAKRSVNRIEREHPMPKMEIEDDTTKARRDREMESGL